MSFEQICRDLLEQAINDGIVTAKVKGMPVQQLSDTDLVGMANLLQQPWKSIAKEMFWRLI